MSRPTPRELWPRSTPESAGASPAAPAPYGIPAAPPAPAPQQPIRHSGWRTFWSIFVHEMRPDPREIAGELLFQLLELAVNVVVAAAVIGVFALVGYAVAGSTGAIVAGLIGLGVFLVLRILVYVGIVVGGLGWLVLSRKNRG